MAAAVKVLDGGFSTQLSRYVGGMDGDPLWTARFIKTNPDAVTQTHLDFLNAGSEYIETCTYQASVYGFCKHLNVSKEEAEELIKMAGILAIKAKNKYLENHTDADVQVVGSIGPFGALLHDGSEYTGDYTDKVTAEMIIETQKPRIEKLIEAGISMFAFETIPSKKEALIVADLIKQYPIKAWFSFSCKDNKSLSNGDDFKETAISCYKKNPEQIIAVGVNCTNPLFVHYLFEGINKNQNESIIPLVAYPNSGEKYTTEAGWQGQAHIEPLHMFVKDWIDLGTRYIGGCCRIGSDDILKIKKEIEKLKNTL